MNHNEIVYNIERVIKEKGHTINYALVNSGAGSNLIGNMKKAKPQTPSVDKIMALASFLNVSMDYLMGLTTNVEPQQTVLSDEHKGLVSDYDKLDWKGKRTVISTLQNELDRMEGLQTSRTTSGIA